MTSIRSLVRLVAIPAVVASASPAHAQRFNDKLDRALQEAPAGSRQAVIIRYRSGADSAITTQLQSRGHRIRVRFETVGAAVADVNTEDLQSLAEIGRAHV